MELSVPTWSFRECTLTEAVGITKAIGINAVDIGNEGRSAISNKAVVENPAALSTQIKKLGIKISNYYHLFGESESLEDRNLADPNSRKINLKDFRQVVKFCQSSKIPTVMLLPGIINPGQSRNIAFEESCKTLNEINNISSDAGIVTTIEPHVGSFLETPQLTLDLLGRVPGLKLTLDYSHFIYLGYSQYEIDTLIPHAAHMHIRHARPGFLQSKTHNSALNIPALLGLLKESCYKGYIALEYEHLPNFDLFQDDVLTETIKMRDLVLRYL